MIFFMLDPQKDNGITKDAFTRWLLSAIISQLKHVA